MDVVGDKRQHFQFISIVYIDCEWNSIRFYGGKRYLRYQKHFSKLHAVDTTPTVASVVEVHHFHTFYSVMLTHGGEVDENSDLLDGTWDLEACLVLYLSATEVHILTVSFMIKY